MEDSRRLLQLALSSIALLGLACERPASPPAISLVERFAEAEVSGSPEVAVEHPRLEWRFDGEGTLEPVGEEHAATVGWRELHDVEGLAVADGRLTARASGPRPILAVEVPAETLPEDVLGELVLSLAASSGTKLGVLTFADEKIDVEELLEDLGDREMADFVVDLEPGEESHDYTLTDAASPWAVLALGRLRHLGIILFGAEGARIELESVRLASRTETLARVPAGVGWHGLGEIFRETVVSRSPEKLSWEVALGARPWLDLAVGSPEAHPATYRVEVAAEGVEPVTLRRTVTTADEWHDIALPLDALAGRTARLTLALETEEPGHIGFWGTPTVRHRRAPPAAAEPTAARAALGSPGPPRGVIVMVADTLRSDHLDAWGYDRTTAPTLADLASEGTRFADTVSQGAWTKIAVPSILTSLYPSTHGIVDIPDRLPASVTTLAEAFRAAGYATFHTSSVPFSGRNSNLQQGVEVLHERASVEGLDEHRSKTARTYVDRLIPWLEAHREQPFFVFLHVFDPHSPFRPFTPWDDRWLSAEEIATHEKNLETMAEAVPDFHDHLPTREQLAEAGVDAEVFVAAERAWYDASIRAMDAEVARLFDRLAELDLADDVLFAFVADHGEEFLEHGRHWHGHSLYGEMVNVPMLVRWPGVVPAGLAVETTTQSIDLMPTLLDLAQVPVPEAAQGRSLLPLLAAPEDPGTLGWKRAPVFTERKDPPTEETEGSPDAYAVVLDGWKLIWNETVRDGRPELELFDHRSDPLNLVNVADEHPEKVAELKALIDGWRAEAVAARPSDEGLAEDLSSEELEQLKALGYID